MDTTKRAAWTCPTCRATNVGARCGCTKAVTADDTLERINALHLVIPRRTKR